MSEECARTRVCGHSEPVVHSLCWLRRNGPDECAEEEIVVEPVEHTEADQEANGDTTQVALEKERDTSKQIESACCMVRLSDATVRVVRFRASEELRR